jgi:hypothetical protein
VIVPAAEVDACAEHTVSFADTVVDGTQRELAVHSIAAFPAPATPLLIKARRVLSSPATCPVETAVEFKTRDGEWRQMRDDALLALDTTADQRTISISPSQKDFLNDDFFNMFGTRSVDGRQVSIEARFVATSAVRPDIQDIDTFEFTIAGSGQKAADLCDGEFTALAMAAGKGITGTRDYIVKEQAERRKIALIEYDIDGLAAITDSQCRAQLHAVIEYQLPSGRWEKAWSETGAEETLVS